MQSRDALTIRSDVVCCSAAYHRCCKSVCSADRRQRKQLRGQSRRSILHTGKDQFFVEDGLGDRMWIREKGGLLHDRTQWLSYIRVLTALKLWVPQEDCPISLISQSPFRSSSNHSSPLYVGYWRVRALRIISPIHPQSENAGYPGAPPTNNDLRHFLLWLWNVVSYCNLWMHPWVDEAILHRPLIRKPHGKMSQRLNCWLGTYQFLVLIVAILCIQNPNTGVQL
jgi:hypothetical protein